MHQEWDCYHSFNPHNLLLYTPLKSVFQLSQETNQTLLSRIILTVTSNEKLFQNSYSCLKRCYSHGGKFQLKFQQWRSNLYNPESSLEIQLSHNNGYKKQNNIVCSLGLVTSVYVAGVSIPGGICNNSKTNRHTSKKH